MKKVMEHENGRQRGAGAGSRSWVPAPLGTYLPGYLAPWVPTPRGVGASPRGVGYPGR